MWRRSRSITPTRLLKRPGNAGDATTAAALEIVNNRTKKSSLRLPVAEFLRRSGTQCLPENKKGDSFAAMSTACSALVRQMCAPIPHKNILRLSCFRARGESSARARSQSKISLNYPSDRNVSWQNGITPSHPKCELILGRLHSQLSCRFRLRRFRRFRSLCRLDCHRWCGGACWHSRALRHLDPHRHRRHDETLENFDVTRDFWHSKPFLINYISQRRRRLS
jgi:hypothetical protein